MMVYAPSREALEHTLTVLLDNREAILSDPKDFMNPNSGLADITEMIAFVKATLTMMDEEK